MGCFTNVANWIAVVHLEGTRTAQIVARFIGGLVVHFYKAAKELDRTTSVLPANVIGLTQLLERSGVQQEDGVDTEDDEELDTASEGESADENCPHNALKFTYFEI